MSSEQRSDRNWFARHKVLTAVGAITVLVVIGSAAGSGSGSSQHTSASGGKQSPTAPAQQQKPAGIDGSGTYQVGADIKPGTYKSTGNQDGQCYWEREKDASGSTDSILANDTVTGTSYVTIKASDKYFKSADCGNWVVASAATAGSPQTQMSGDGMYQVGADIKPGTYKSTGNENDQCYWERTKDATGDSDSIIANDNVSGTAVVTISASDAYFKTNGCSAWKKS